MRKKEPCITLARRDDGATVLRATRRFSDKDNDHVIVYDVAVDHERIKREGAEYLLGLIHCAERETGVTRRSSSVTKLVQSCRRARVFKAGADAALTAIGRGGKTGWA